MAQPLQRPLGNKLVAPRCGNDRMVADGETRMRQLDGRSWRRGKHDVRAEDEQREIGHVGPTAREAPLPRPVKSGPDIANPCRVA